MERSNKTKAVKIRKRTQSLTLVYELLLYSFIVYMIFKSSYLENFLGISISFWGTLITWGLSLLLFFLFILESLKDRVTRKKIFFILVVGILLAISFTSIGDSTIIISFLFILLYPNKLPVKRVAFRISISVCYAILFIVFLSWIGKLPDFIGTREGGVLRHSLGFVSANALANSVLISCLNYFYGKIDKWKIKNTIFFLLIGATTYIITYSRMSTFIIFSLAIFSLFYRKIKQWKISRVIYSMTAYLFPIISLTMIIFTNYFLTHKGSTIYNTINKFSSGRVYWGGYYLEKYGLSFWGQNIETVGSKKATTTGLKWMGLDSSYLMIAIRYGLIFTILFSLGYYFLGKRLQEKNDLAGAVIAICILFIGVTENYVYGINYNLAMLLFAHEFYFNKRSNEIFYDER